jgi:predicted Zn-dependent protease
MSPGRRFQRIALLTLCLASPSVPARAQDLQAIFDGFFAERPEDRQRLERVSVSIAEERRWGRQAFEQYLQLLRQQGVPVNNRGRDVVYLRALAAELRDQLRQPDRYGHPEICVADADWTDARCFPGGWIVVSRGLLEFAETEAAVVGVLAHEMAHLDRGHTLELPRRIKLAEQTMAGANFQPDQFFQTGKLFAQYFARPFRPEQEAEADAEATRWLVASNYDALEWARLFQRMRARDGQTPAALPSFLRTHPAPADRDRAVRQLLDQLPAPQLGARPYRGRENLQRRIPRSQRRFAE